ncbi:MAG TPA: hypothetical protein VI759_02395 [Dehalococcoidia bacterium]|nr:hypothetical protein [Dehalococcoidia bacterium]
MARALVAILAVLLFVACSKGDDANTKTDPTAPAVPAGDAPAALKASQSVLDKAGGYRLRVEQSNFVLPQWGGSDGGSVVVNGDGAAAKAELARTGEPNATYTITLTGGTTYFKRSTCKESFRMPGGGVDVLKPYLFTKTQALANAKDAKYEGNLIRATIEGLGSVTIELDPKTLRPSQIRGAVNGRDLRWTFEDWGADPKASKPGGSLQDRGPGGVPC